MADVDKGEGRFFLRFFLRLGTNFGASRIHRPYHHILAYLLVVRMSYLVDDHQYIA